MPYCSECDNEFQNWVQVCPDCGAALVDKLPKPPPLKPKPKANADKDSLMHIATAPNEPLARMWAGILENEGIYSLVKSIDLSVAWYLPSLLSHYEIHVLSSQAEKASKILAPLLKDV